MKLSYPTLIIASVLFLSCDRTEVEPVKPSRILPLRLELDDYKREFSFDASDRVTTVKNTSYMPGDVVLETIIEYHYDGDRLEKTVSANGYTLVYSYEDNRITRTDEYLGDQLTQYYTFSYDTDGRLKEYTTWDDIPEYGGVVPKARELYVYDNRDNLSHQFLYAYNHGIRGHELVSSFEFSEYDEYPEAESRFDAYAFNPQAVFRKNNPGKMVVKNRLGNTGMIDTYSYVYDASGYVTEKTTTVTYPHSGSNGFYKTRFFYQTR
jgi:hypothetical protein